ncbi:MAG: tetratricopeptide repeat protein [Magnetococcales bacterium]|nr:tetratricopeptide repeat protein [Magnetococcales bacterium]
MAKKQPQLTVDSAYTKAIKCFNASQFAEADKLCTLILQTVPSHIHAINLIGVIAQRINRHDLAVEQFNRAIIIDDSQDWLHYNLGTSLYQLGRIAEVISVQKKAIAINAKNAEAHSSLGCALTEQGKLDDAVAYLQKAIIIDPKLADAHYNLGVAYQAQEEHHKAATSYNSTISLNPNYTNAYINLGNAQLKLQKPIAAVKSYQKAISLNPNNPLVHSNLGNAYKTQGEFSKAITSQKKAITLDPNFADAYHNLGVIYKEQKNWQKGIECFKKAIELNPNSLQGYSNLGFVYQQLGELDKGIHYNQQAINIDPNYVDSYINIGDILHQQNRLDDAVSSYQKAILLEPNNVEAHCNIGATLQALGKLNAAITSFNHVITIDPSYAKAHCNLSLVQLLNGDFFNGFKNYIWRWQLSQFDSQRYNKNKNKLWRGEAVENKKILLWEEQGVGESILFSSMLPDLIAQGADITIECDKRLIPLYNRSFKNIKCQTKSRALNNSSDFDYTAPFGNMGLYLRHKKSSFPLRKGYLKANENQKNIFLHSYKSKKDSFIVGISWHSNKSADFLTKKSVDLQLLYPLLKTPGVQFVNLQYGDTTREINKSAKECGVKIVQDKSVDQLTDLDGFAAQVAAMDLIITISNTTAHMAGALGIPTFLMLGVTPLWYWMVEGENSPWYPSITIFRQKKLGDWDDVIDRVKQELNNKLF